MNPLYRSRGRAGANAGTSRAGTGCAAARGPRFQVALPLVTLAVAQADRHVHQHEGGGMAPRDVGDGRRDEVRMRAQFGERDRDPTGAAAVHSDEIHGPEV